MGELEPNDSRNVTLRDQRAPGEPPRTGPLESDTRGQNQQQSPQSQQQSDWRAIEAAQDREAQDHEAAGDLDSAPSLRADDEGSQWSQQPVDDQVYAQPQQGDADARLETEVRGPRDSMRQQDDSSRRQQAERGGG